MGVDKWLIQGVKDLWIEGLSNLKIVSLDKHNDKVVIGEE